MVGYALLSQTATGNFVYELFAALTTIKDWFYDVLSTYYNNLNSGELIHKQMRKERK